ncbi:PAAR domain-containing protein [Rubripirellula reticaptiva]|uniref:PAAR motif protein n=1 Tax=Rubripirellula reticaptiva TaxID=2528013 RepID=A0A5C6F397_9BACT|nr:PAAR domain-containing protein [Rubripirellula reticaptiva]TWU56283.1 PAAR motif protein [Rubripirellula reticaptiva]
MPAAARVTDPHSCTSLTGVVPHVGGPLEGPGAPTVLIGGLPAAIVGDSAACNGPPDTLIEGSATVMIGGVPAVRMGDPTEHGGTVDAGAPDVMIGG